MIDAAWSRGLDHAQVLRVVPTTVRGACVEMVASVGARMIVGGSIL
jgi:hypothetical protein